MAPLQSQSIGRTDQDPRALISSQNDEKCRLKSATRKGWQAGSRQCLMTFLTLFLFTIQPAFASTRSYQPTKAYPLPSPSSDNTLEEVQLRQVADSFESVLKAMCQSEQDSIPMEPLLDACHTLLAVMQKTGPKAVARDFGNNLKKIEASVNRPQQSNAHTISSLLQLERDSGLHQYRPGNESSLELHEKSGAMGLLWIRRTLAFQSDFYEQLLNGRDSKEAACHAYQQQLKPYHGWKLIKCYNLLVGNSMPPRRLLLARIGGYQQPEEHEEEKTLQELKRLVASWQPLIQRWKRSFIELCMEDTRRV